MRTETVTSAQNPKIRELLSLYGKSKARREKGVFVVEGKRELGHCIDAGYRARSLFLCPEIISGDEIREITEKVSAGSGDCCLIEVPRHLYDRIAYRGGTEGIIAEVRIEERGIEDIRLKENPLIVVLEAVEKPGNLGAVLRSADAAGADAVIVCDPLTDLYNPNLIRSSIGAVFTTQTAVADSAKTISWLKKHGIRIYTAQLQDSLPYYNTDMKHGTAIVLGTESTGLTSLWRENADSHIRIPMSGELDSLNVSVSAAILLFEAVRQRNIQKQDGE